MQTVLPREEAVEGVISKVLESQEACDRLNEVFYEHLENYQEINDDGDRHLQRSCSRRIKMEMSARCYLNCAEEVCLICFGTHI